MRQNITIRQWPRWYFCFLGIYLLASSSWCQNSNVVANSFQATSQGATTTQGSYIFWNLSQGAGEADFVNNDGGGWRGGYVFYNAPSSGAPLTSLMRITGSGSIGLQTDWPQNVLSVSGGLNVDQNDDNNGGPFYNYNESILGISFGYSSGEGIASARVDQSPNQFGLDFFTSFQKRLSITNSGSVGVGLANPGADLPLQNGPVLETVGNIAMQQGATPGHGTGAGIIFSDGTVQTTAYVGTSCPVMAELVMPDKTIVAQGGDYAESVDVNGDRASYEPGDVMVIDPSNPEHFLKSSRPYSTLVAGIYSTKPGYVGRRQPGDPKMDKTEIPMAMIGIVPTKVTTENGPIKVGDLLVTSSTIGYAMKGTKRKAMSGAIVGKALSKIDSGIGMIAVLVSLQ